MPVGEKVQLLVGVSEVRSRPNCTPVPKERRGPAVQLDIFRCISEVSN